MLECGSVDQELGLVLHGKGVAAVVIGGEPQSVDIIARSLRVPPEQLPRLLLSRKVSTEDDAAWFSLSSGTPSRIKLDAVSRDFINMARPPVGKEMASKIVGDIFEYYTAQVREPATRGFLSILERQFPRNDLYLFELLQNSVDDGAFNVSVGVKDGALHFSHDGALFTPLDVLGLASVGLSTKKGRSIGFMGVGFKAVYKRFSRVEVCDKTWCFQFAAPPGHSNHSVRDWVLLPKWSERDTSRESGCHFIMSQPVGGQKALQNDMTSLPHTATVLLGHTALTRSDGKQEAWSLSWQGLATQVRMQGDMGGGGGERLRTSVSGVVTRTGAGGVTKETEWVFIRRGFKVGSEVSSERLANPCSPRNRAVASRVCLPPVLICRHKQPSRIIPRRRMLLPMTSFSVFSR